MKDYILCQIQFHLQDASLWVHAHTHFHFQVVGFQKALSQAPCRPRINLPLIQEGNGSPLQWSSLENPRDGGAWWAAV